MTKIFNKKSQINKRRILRNNLTNAEQILYVADFYCPELKLVVELDGEQHAVLENKLYDNERKRFMKSLGIRTIRVLNQSVFEKIDGVLEKIKSITDPFPQPLPP